MKHSALFARLCLSSTFICSLGACANGFQFDKLPEPTSIPTVPGPLDPLPDVLPPAQTTFNAPAWWLDRGNLAQTASINEPLKLPLQVRWQVSLPGPVRTPASGGNGNLYMGSGDSLYALSPQDGSTNWQYQTGTQEVIANPVAVLSENKGQLQKVYLVDGTGGLHALQGQDGTLLWKLPSQGPSQVANLPQVSSAPIVAGNFLFYRRAKNSGGMLRAVSPEDGHLLWEKSTQTSAHPPLYGFGGLFVSYCSNSKEPVSRLDEVTGQINWTYVDEAAASMNSCAPVGVLDMDVKLGQPARLLISNRENPPHVAALAASTGQLLWRTPLSGSSDVQGFALTQERESNTLIVVQPDKMYAVTPDTGVLLWSREIEQNNHFNSTASKRRLQPAIWGDYVFHVVGDRWLKAFALADGTEVWSYDLGSSNSSPIVGGNSLYIGTEEGKVLAFSAAG